MRPLVLLALLLPLHASAAEEGDFSGAWVAWLCPAGVQRESGKCSNFVLELHQKEGKLCGAHFYSTAGAEQVDEGAAPSLTGDIAGDAANVVTISNRGRTPIRVRAEIKKANGALQWQRLENPPGDYLLPLTARLTKSRSKTLFAPVFEHQLRAACASLFTMTAQQDRVPLPGEQGPAKDASKD